MNRNVDTANSESWLEWAKKKLDWYDPHIEADDELLKDVDRDTLVFVSPAQGST